MRASFHGDARENARVTPRSTGTFLEHAPPAAPALRRVRIDRRVLDAPRRTPTIRVRGATRARGGRARALARRRRRLQRLLLRRLAVRRTPGKLDARRRCAL